MASSTPIVRQIAWSSVIVHIGVLLILIGVAYAMGYRQYPIVGAASFLALSTLLRNIVPSHHVKGTRYIRLEKWADAANAYEKGLEQFERRPWLDNWRFITCFSSSRISYREMALVNLGFCYAQLGDGVRSKHYYERALQQFPDSKIAQAALNHFRAAQAQTDVDNATG